MTIAAIAAAAKPEETALFLEKLCWLDRGPSLLLDENRAWASDFAALLKINTPESLLAAAMMLVPEGWALDCLKEGEVGSWYVNLRSRDWVSEWSYSKAATPALALIAAIAQSKGV